MDQDLWRLDLEALKIMYVQQSGRLATLLLEGVDWEELNEQRAIVTELSIIIERKSQEAIDHPAENALRYMH